MNYVQKNFFNDVIKIAIIGYFHMNGVVVFNMLVNFSNKKFDFIFLKFLLLVLPCELHNYDLDKAFWNKSIEGIFRPQCNSNGYYASRQCNTDTPRKCWCVDKHGIEVEGTRQDDDHMPQCGM